MNYTAIITKQDDFYSGFIKDIPGANSQGKTIEEVTENLKEAIELILDANLNHNLNPDNSNDYIEKVITL